MFAITNNSKINNFAHLWLLTQRGREGMMTLGPWDTSWDIKSIVKAIIKIKSRERWTVQRNERWSKTLGSSHMSEGKKYLYHSKIMC